MPERYTVRRIKVERVADPKFLKYVFYFSETGKHFGVYDTRKHEIVYWSNRFEDVDRVKDRMNREDC